MTLQEAKEQWAVENGWEKWIDFQSNRPSHTYLGVIHHLAEQLIQSAVKEAREQAITDIEEIVIKLSSKSMHYDHAKTSLLMKELNNLKKNSICTHDKEPVTGKNGCEECPDCGKYGEDC